MAWKSIADLFGRNGEVALLGAPMEAGSVTPGRCDLAPAVLRRTLRRFSTYDVETGTAIGTGLLDRGDVPVQGIDPADGFEPIRAAVSESVAAHRLTEAVGHLAHRRFPAGPLPATQARDS